MSESPLKREFEYYLANQDALVKQYNGKHIVIKNLTVLGAFDDSLTAIEATTKQGHALGTFLVQKVEPGTSAYTQTFHSRVAFA